MEAFESLEKRTRVQLEDTILTQLHTTLVKVGDRHINNETDRP